jgi:hypothetical protein
MREVVFYHYGVAKKSELSVSPGALLDKALSRGVKKGNRYVFSQNWRTVFGLQ